MGLVTLFRGPRFLVSLYFQAQGSKLFRPVVYFSIPVIGRSFGKDRGPRLLEVVFQCLSSPPSI